MTDVPAAALVTADDLLRMPDDYWRYELVRGGLIRRSFAGSRSGVLSASIGARLNAYTEEHDLGICVAADCGFLLESAPDTVRAPSVGFVRAERISSDGIPEGYWPGAPDLAVEVASPTDRFPYLLAKVIDYLTAGTRLVWVIDPEARKALIFRPGQEPEIVDADGELSGEEVVPGFVLRLADVWV